VKLLIWLRDFTLQNQTGDSNHRKDLGCTLKIYT